MRPTPAKSGLVSVLRSQIAMTPRGTYRTALEKHLEETREHARRVQERLQELEQGGDPLQAFLGVAETRDQPDAGARQDAV